MSALARSQLSAERCVATHLKKSPMSESGLQAMLRPEDSILVLIDHQPYQFANLHSATIAPAQPRADAFVR